MDNNVVKAERGVGAMWRGSKRRKMGDMGNSINNKKKKGEKKENLSRQQVVKWERQVSGYRTHGRNLKD